MAASEEGCSEPAGRFGCTFVDPIRNAALTVAAPQSAGEGVTLRDILSLVRAADLARPAPAEREPLSADLEPRRFADSLFRLTDDGALAGLISGLRFRIGGRECGLDHRLGSERFAGSIAIDVDRSQTGYTRNWPAYLRRRWKLRERAYSRFVESVVEETFGPEAASILALETPAQIQRFLRAVAGRIYAAPYETYSRYLDPGTPFKSCDQTLDRIIEGDGGNCAEKAMALYFIAHAYGIGAEVVLGGEEASGKFPYRALRSILDQRTFHAEPSRDPQRHWQHYAILCRPSHDASDDVFCDVAGSNIPFLFLNADSASGYLDPYQKRSLPVVITLEPIPLYYHRLARFQDLPLDLYYAMEHYIEAIDVIHTVDNELGLVHTGDFWVGVVAFRGRRALNRIVAEYERLVLRAGLDPAADLCFAPALVPARHPLAERFVGLYSDSAARIAAADARLRSRVSSANPEAELSYVIMNLRRAQRSKEATQAGPCGTSELG